VLILLGTIAGLIIALTAFNPAERAGSVLSSIA
jgi:hypothetical protein